MEAIRFPVLTLEVVPVSVDQVASDGSIRFLTTAGASFSSAGVVKLNQWTLNQIFNIEKKL